jgi:hypothetical protein
MLPDLVQRAPKRRYLSRRYALAADRQVKTVVGRQGLWVFALMARLRWAAILELVYAPDTGFVDLAASLGPARTT